MRTIFVDTAYWIARSDYRDQLHAKALEIEPQLRRARLTTSELVLTEFLNYFSNAGQQAREGASGAIQDILADPSVQIIWQTQALFEAGLALYKARLDKGHSLTDCVSMVVMQQSDIQAVLTHDRHFAQEGLALLL